MTPSPRPRPSSLPPVQYKGSELDAARGPGLGCFWLQLVVLAILVVLTPVGVNLGWPDWLNALLLFATIGLLLVSGQTIIFLLRIVAAERREGRRRPMAAARSATVGELEDVADAGVGGDGGSPPDEVDDGGTSGTAAPDGIARPTPPPEPGSLSAEPDGPPAERMPE